jgi:FkbM family methyltransferase
MSHFLNTLDQIVHSDSVRPIEGLRRHWQWQVRKLLNRFPCAMPIAGSRLYVDRPGGVAALVNAMGEYDYNNMELLRLVMSRGTPTFFDVGANIGAYTLLASEFPNTFVVAIEPHPSTFSLLKQNIDLNSRDNVICMNIAFSDSEGIVLFSDYSESSINRILKPGEMESKSICVACQRFDEVCLGLQMEPNFIKIDVEGHEQHVLEGFGSLIDKAKMIFIERGEYPELRSILQCAGYNGPWFVHFRNKTFLKSTQTRAEDPIYIRPDFMAELVNLNFVFG